MRQTEQITLSNQVAKESDIEWIKDELVQWKKPQFPEMPTEYDELNRPKFSKDELYKIDSLCKYAKAVDLMKKDRNYREYILKFVFKNTSENCPNAVDIAIQFPTLAKKISASFIDKRIKRLTKTTGLSIKEEIIDNIVTKNVFLRMQKVDEPLRNMTRAITFHDKKTQEDRILTVDQIFQEFATKDASGTSHFEYTENGIDLCYPKSPVIDFESNTWWTGLPVIETLSRAEVEDKYNVTMAGKKAILALRATREKDPLHVQGNHGWLQIVLPQNDGSFTVHAIGKYAKHFPQGAIQTLLFTFGTHPGLLTTLDENEFYSHREHCIIPKTLTYAQFVRLMDKLKSDLQDSFNDNMVFQAQGQNCSAWVQEVVHAVFGADEHRKHRIPQLFEVPVVETTAPKPIDMVINGIRLLETISHHVAKVARLALATLLGGAWSITTTRDGRQIKNSIVTHEPWLRGYLALPALLFSREKQQKLQEAFDKL